jgi:hypothetical protein
MKPIKMINLALHFLLELCGLAALIYWGFQAGEGLMKFVSGVIMPLLAAVAWGTFRVPNDPGRAPVAVRGPVRLLLETIFFVLAVVALSSAGQPTLAALLGITVVINYAIMYERVIWLLKH